MLHYAFIKKNKVYIYPIEYPNTYSRVLPKQCAHLAKE